MVGCVISDIVRAAALLMRLRKLQIFTLSWKRRGLAVDDIQEREDTLYAAVYVRK